MKLRCLLFGHRWGGWVTCWPETLLEINRCLRCPTERERRRGLR